MWTTGVPRKGGLLRARAGRPGGPGRAAGRAGGPAGGRDGAAAPRVRR